MYTKPKSFTVDHIQLQPGLYSYHANGTHVFDVRVVAPQDAANNHHYMRLEVLHTLEHALAFYFRGQSYLGKKTVYVGPMGCGTGFYLLFDLSVSYQEVKDELITAFESVLEIPSGQAIPGATAMECGNFELFDLDKAKDFARGYLEVLKNITEEMEYPH